MAQVSCFRTKIKGQKIMLRKREKLIIRLEIRSLSQYNDKS